MSLVDLDSEARDFLPADIAEQTPMAEEHEMATAEAADMDTQPLDDLGVSVMDQDVLERNVAAQVCALKG